MDARTIGYYAGRISAYGQRTLLVNGWFLKRAFLVIVLIYSLPPLTQYWLSHTRMPDVSVSAILALIAGAMFIVAVTCLMYVALHFGRMIAQVERNVVIHNNGVNPVHPGKIDRTPSEGTFTPVTDSDAWVQEQLKDLEKKGVLMNTDVSDIEQLARELAGNVKRQ
jgi:hypothetical protein